MKTLTMETNGVFRLHVGPLVKAYAELLEPIVGRVLQGTEWLYFQVPREGLDAARCWMMDRLREEGVYWDLRTGEFTSLDETWSFEELVEVWDYRQSKEEVHG